MTPQNKILRGKCVAHWERLKRHVKGEVLGPSQCAFCNTYNRSHQDFPQCEGCPISEKTGRNYCIDTPYYVAIVALADYHRAKRGERAKANWNWKIACDRMIAFLKAL